MLVEQPEPVTEIDTKTVDVLVVGGGPVGLSAAIELGHHGLRVLVVDGGNGVVSYPTAESIDVRTMEWLRKVGISDAVDGSGFPNDYPRDISFVTHLTGHEVARFARPSNKDRAATTVGISPEGAVWWPKFWFDSALRSRARASRGVSVHYGWSCEEIAQYRGRVEMGLRSVRGGHATVRARYVVGCDGARSAVRRLSGIEMEGSPAEATWQGAFVRIPDLLSAIPHAPAVQFYLLRPRRMIFGSLDGGAYWRVTYPLWPGERTTPEDVLVAIGNGIGRSDLEIELRDTRPWTGHTLIANQFRDRRVFLAGDAAHLMWPSGGHGMNTGLGDIANLGWKIAKAVRTGADHRLLDSYEVERKPIARRNTQRAAHNYRADLSLPTHPALEAIGREGDAARDAAADAVVAKRAAEWQSLGVQLGFRYENSPIIVPDGTPSPPDEPSNYWPTARPGHRAPHVELPDGRSTLDLVSTGFVLVSTVDTSTGEWMAAFAGRGLELRACQLNLPEARRAYGADLVLIRPDGIVAWRGNASADVRTIVDVVSGGAAMAHPEASAC